MATASGEGSGETLRERLLQTAEAFSEEWGLEYSSDASDMLMAAFAQVEDRLDREGKLDDEQALSQAEDALREWLMSAGPGKLQHSYREAEDRERLTRADLASGLSILCPGFWPFC